MAIDTIFADDTVTSRRTPRTLFRRAWHAYRAWALKRRTRYQLLELTDEQLLDIGISRSEARLETARSFYWD